MYKVFNYNKNFSKKINYKFYKILLILFYISFIFLFIYICINSKIGIPLFIVWLILFATLNLIIFLILRKTFNCNVYILNEDTHEFYKMGIFPHVIRFKPNTEEFLTDNHFGNYIYSNFGKAIILGLKKYFNYSVKEYVNDNIELRFSEGNQLLYLNSQIKLNNSKYVIKQLNNKNFRGMVFKITKIYSYQFDEPDNYYIVCDVIETNKQIEYKNMKLTINKLFEENNMIKNYIINNCER